MTKRLHATSDEQNIEKLEGRKRLLQAYEIYNNLADGKLEDFKNLKDYLAETLENLYQKGKIGREVVMLSRVKSPSSVVRNWKLGKNLNDIFGITLLTVGQEEIDEIRNEIMKHSELDICSRKQRNEKRGYEAIHFIFNIGEGEKKTKVECHLQTHKAYENVYPHVFYKVRRELGRNLTSEEEEMISKKIQSMYESGELSGYNLSGGRKSKIPQMWVSSFDQDGKMVELQLEEDIILTIMYPSLDISKNKNTGSGLIKTKNEEKEL